MSAAGEDAPEDAAEMFSKEAASLFTVGGHSSICHFTVRANHE